MTAEEGEVEEATVPDRGALMLMWSPVDGMICSRVNPGRRRA
jgi:hypothetical protein